VKLALKPPIEPQLARSRAELPEGDQWVYEPKYDGFRAIVFVDGEEVMIQSRSGKPLARYFPELRFPPGRYVVDGEIVAYVIHESGADEVLRHEPRERTVSVVSAPPLVFELLERVGHLVGIPEADPVAGRRKLSGERLQCREPADRRCGVEDRTVGTGRGDSGRGLQRDRDGNRSVLAALPAAWGLPRGQLIRTARKP